MTASSDGGRLILHYGGGESWTTAVRLRRAASDQTRVWEAAHRDHRRLDLLASEDHYLWVESGRSSYPLDSHCASSTTAGYLIDVHCHLAMSRLQSTLFDVAFVAQRDYIPALAAHHPVVEWLPLAAPQAFLHLPRRDRYDVAFVGRTDGLPARTRILEALAQQFSMNEWWRFHAVEEMGDVYSQSRVVLNLPVKGDLNMRFFEAMAAGAALVQPLIANGVRKVATPGTHYVELHAFGDPDRLVTEIAALLRTDRPERVGEAARELIAQAHTYEHRLATVEAVMERAAARAAPIRGFNRSERRRFWAALSRATGDGALVKHLLREFPDAALQHPALLTGALISASRRTAAARHP